MLTEIFGEKCKRATVFDLLLSHPYTEYTKTDIAEITGISRNTLDTFIPEILEYGIIKPTRRIGHGQLYQINLDSTITQALNSFQNQLADIEIEKEMEKQQKLNANIKPIKPFEEIVKKEAKNESIELGYRLNSFIETNKPVITEIKGSSENGLINYNIEGTGSQTSVFITGTGNSTSETNMVDVCN